MGERCENSVKIWGLVVCEFECQVKRDCKDYLCRCLSFVFFVLSQAEIEGIFLIVLLVCDARKG